MSIHFVVSRAGVVVCTLAALIMACATNEAQEDATKITRFREAVAQLDLQEQRDLFTRMTPEMRLALWQSRLRGAVHSVKTADQKTVLQTLSNALTVEMYAGRSAECVAESKEFTAVWAKLGPTVEKAFERDGERLDTILTRLGDANLGPTVEKAFERDGQRPDTILTRLGDAKPVAASVVKSASPTCNCSTSRNGALRANDCGPLSKACVKGGCEPTWFGCGTLWLSCCDGLCKK